MSKATKQSNNAFPQFDKNQFDKMMKDSTNFGTQYSDAYTKSSAILMKGFEDIMGTVMAVAQDSAEKQSKFAKEVMGVKTINEFTEIQNKMAQASFDDFVSNATKISEISVKVLTESAEPVSTQVTSAIQKATKSMAA